MWQCKWLKWRHLVAKFETNISGAIWWPKKGWQMLQQDKTRQDIFPVNWSSCTHAWIFAQQRDAKNFTTTLITKHISKSGSLLQHQIKQKKTYFGLIWCTSMQKSWANTMFLNCLIYLTITLEQAKASLNRLSTATFTDIKTQWIDKMKINLGSNTYYFVFYLSCNESTPGKSCRKVINHVFQFCALFSRLFIAP